METEISETFASTIYRRFQAPPYAFSFADLVWVLGIGFGAGAIALGAALGARRIFPALAGDLPLLVGIMFAVGLVLYLGFLAATFWRVRRAGGQFLTLFLKPSGKWLAMAAGAPPIIILSMGILETLALPLADQERLMELQWTNLPHSGPAFWIFAFVALVGAPFAEEVLFRGILFGWLTTRVGLAWAALVSSITFALVHGLLGSPGDPVYWFANAQLTLIGLTAAWLCLKSGSLLAPVLFHSVNNAIALVGFVVLAPMATG